MFESVTARVENRFVSSSLFLGAAEPISFDLRKRVSAAFQFCDASFYSRHMNELISLKNGFCSVQTFRQKMRACGACAIYRIALH